MDDPESLEVLRDAAAEPLGIPPAMRHRLRGSSISELRDDARRLAQEIGLRPTQPRDGQGRFAGGEGGDMNSRIREAAGR